MKRIILASRSPQRQKLLKRLGLRFTVRVSHVKERKTIKTTCSSFVKHNALLKAEDIARGIKNGIVIGADTIAYTGNGKIIGKPRDHNHARRILKILGRRPQWIYTGVALVDAKTKKGVVDYEKTKVFMNKLTDEEIRRYHRRASVLDKAGGFDIEGHGGLFIRRIEGCYYNVIGLPLAKLCVMLKKMGVHVLGLILMLHLTGCATEYNLATGREETLIYGTDKEVSIGSGVARQFDEHFKLNTDMDVNERVERILDRLVRVSDRKDLVYIIKVIKDDKMNAVSLPGGYIYVFQGLIDRVDNDDQLAGVIAHELGHITAKHAIKRLQNAYGYTLLQLGAYGAGNAQLARGLNAAFTSMFFSHSQAAEFESDRLAVKYMRKAGFDPNEMVTFLGKLKAHQDKEPLRKFGYWRTHPYLPQRMAVVNHEITGKLEFRDYLNLTGE